MTMTRLINIHAKDENIKMGISSISEDSFDPTNNGSVPANNIAINFCLRFNKLTIRSLKCQIATPNAVCWIHMEE
jgi:hypothetical protein